jgi:hypothetical protein
MMHGQKTIKILLICSQLMNKLKIIDIIFFILCREAPDIFRPILQQTAHQRAAGAAPSNGKIVTTRVVRSYCGSVILHPLIIISGCKINY